jgi:hypothetical protein
MHRTLSAVSAISLLSLASSLLPSTHATAATILQTSGPPFISAGIGQGNGQQAGAIGFSTANRLDNVTFTVPLNYDTVGFPPHTIHAYLTNSLGPSTTVANLLAQNSVVITGGQHANFQVMSYPTLDPGNYYLMLVDPDLNLVGWDSLYPPTTTTTAAPGVQLTHSYGYAQESGSFPPAYQDNGDTRDATIFPSIYQFDIEGTVVPEPATLMLLAPLLATLVAASRPKRSPRPGA